MGAALTADACPWVLDADSFYEALEELAKLVAACDGGGTALARLHDKAKTTKMHTWAFVIGGPVGIIALEHASEMPPHQRSALKGLLYLIALLSEHDFQRADLDKLQVLLDETLVKVETYLCSTELDAKLHYLRHSVERIKALGPAWTTAMWKYEGMWYILRCVSSRPTN